MNRKMQWLFFFLVCGVIFTACSPKNITDVLSAFKKAGLKLENIREFPLDERGGYMPTSCDITTFQTQNGWLSNYIIICQAQSEVDEWVKYYDIPDNPAVAKNWVFQKGNVIVKINGAEDEDVARQYEKAMP